MVAKQADGVCPQCGGILTALSKGGIFFGLLLIFTIVVLISNGTCSEIIETGPGDYVQ
jgi:hypothetical protein|tara:strand:+ start:731 stop:904 length:174 start_codon:yes stop_codon:yes gene_type:complete